MSYNQQTIKLNKARAEVYVFDNGSEVREAHAMIHADNIGMTYKEQLDAVLDAYASLREDLLKGYVAFSSVTILAIQPTKPKWFWSAKQRNVLYL